VQRKANKALGIVSTFGQCQAFIHYHSQSQFQLFLRLFAFTTTFLSVAHRAGAEGRAAQGQQGARHRLHLWSVPTVNSLIILKVSFNSFSISLPSQLHSYQ
jgi:hypothetical protein